MNPSPPLNTVTFMSSSFSAILPGSVDFAWSIAVTSRRIRDVGRSFGNLEHPLVQAGLLYPGRTSGASRIIGVPVDLQAGVGGRLEKQCDVLTPVAGDNAIRARCLD